MDYLKLGAADPRREDSFLREDGSFVRLRTNSNEWQDPRGTQIDFFQGK